MKRRFKVTTDSQHNYPISENILKRNFTAKAIGQAWVSDITYIKTLTGWLYLTVVLDLADRKVVGWADLKSRFDLEVYEHNLDSKSYYHSGFQNGYR